MSEDQGQGTTRRDSCLKAGAAASGSGVPETMSGFNPATRGGSRVSFLLNTTSDSSPSSENARRISLVINTSSKTSAGSNTFFALNKSGPGPLDSFETNKFGQVSRDSFYVPTQEASAASSSFLAFTMSHTSSPRSSRETHLVPKPKTSLAASSFGAMFREDLSGVPEIRETRKLIPHRESSKLSSVPEQIQKHVQPFYLAKEQLLHVRNAVLSAMEQGLKQKVKDALPLPMLSSYVCALTDGTEQGDFLGLEMKHTQVKVLLLQLSSDREESMVIKKRNFAITEKIINGSGEQLFEFLAQCVAMFLGGLDISVKYYPLGFCFPFRCEHVTINQCKLIKWSKDCRWPGVEGRDVSQLLQAALNQHCKNYQVEVLAVINDAVATMLSCHSEEEQCEVGLIIDAGTNCCYVEETQHMAGLEQKQGCMCISTEWGSLGNAGELTDAMTEYDLLMDKQSMDQGRCRFEKMVSSFYLCDTIRVVLATMAEKGELFSGVLTPTLLTKGKLQLQDVVEIIDEKVGLAKTKNFLFHLGMVASNQDCFHVQQICQAIYVRSANLCAAGLAGVLTHIRVAQGLSEMKIFVAVDGDLYKSRAQYGEILQETLKSLAPECTVTFVTSEEGCVLGAAKVTAAAVRLRNQHEVVAQVLAPFRLSVLDLERLRTMMRQEMEKGLSKETHSSASVRMLPTYVRNLPDGSERGDFLALDLGGTNFRVLLVQVRSKEEGGVHMTSEIYSIPPKIAQSNAKELFDHIVRCILDFHTKHSLAGRTLPLGFTFSFPCHQINLDKGILLRWTKGFSATGCVGEDAVSLLREAVQRQKDVDIDVVAIVNDTVGTMMACAYVDPNCEIGLIVGTGCNACYMEEMRNVGTVEGDEGRMCINMEWGAFGDNGCLEHYITSYDEKVDAASLNIGQQRYEKFISGMYLGEIVRYILLDLASRKVLFKGRSLPVLKTKDIFPTKFLTNVEDSPGHHFVCNILEEYGLNVSTEDALVVKEVCHVVSSRAAKVCAAGVAAVAEKIRQNLRKSKLDVTVGVDGTVYKMHPYFAKKLQDTVALLAPNCNVKFLLSEDGSGKGAALIAAVASHK
ncbi:hexokinase-3 [Rhineura floridana]|uniref:hexokinase-3 n=1 Tax=Rhineura floridana TaxID=261503 RepID=UPI002AC7E6CB|nr:hexokinase-3 [Rhineura floridana]